MADSVLQLRVGQDTVRTETEGEQAYMKGNKRGEACVIDFYTESALEGRGFQLRLGTITTPIVGDVDLTDTAAEAAVNVRQGLAILVVHLNLSVRLGAGTLHEYALKSIDGTATVGTGAVYVPLSMLMDTNAPGAQATAFTGTAGTVTVSAETATTTRRLWSASNPVAVGAGHSLTTHTYEPRTPHMVANVAHVYLQVAAATTGPSYYASYEWLEYAWAAIS